MLLFKKFPYIYNMTKIEQCEIILNNNGDCVNMNCMECHFNYICFAEKYDKTISILNEAKKYSIKIKIQNLNEKINKTHQ